MITVKQAKEALEALYDNAYRQGIESYVTLEEFIHQYEDLIKVKKLSHGALLEPGEDNE